MLAMVILIANSLGSKTKKNSVNFNEDFTLFQPLMQVETPVMPDDYYLTRPRNYEWTQEDVNQWFTPPNGQLLEQLNSANDYMITNILEAAP